MPGVVESQLVVPSFESVDELRAGLEAKRAFESVDLYPRDGSRLLGDVEDQLAWFAGAIDSELLAYNAGMSAVAAAIDVGLDSAETSTPVVACSTETYTQTKKYIEFFLRNKRAEIVYFDSGDFERSNKCSVRGVLERRQPDVIVTETIGNFVGVPVLDTERLLDWTRENEKKPTLVIDNTFPLSTALPLDEVIQDDDRAIVVESGTKSYTRNGALLGVSYTKDMSLFDTLRRLRRTRGDLPGPDHLEKILELLPGDPESFDKRNRRLFENSAAIAIELAAAAPEDGSFVIAHPVLDSHPNHAFYAHEYPDGAVPAFYVQSGTIDQYEIAERLWSHKDVREQARLGQSFGFDHTRIVADEDVGAVRISGGSETDGKALGEACAEALYIDE